MAKSKKKTFITAAQLAAAKDFEIEAVEVPEWGGWVNIRSLSARERDLFEESIGAEEGKQNLVNLRARLVVLCLCDEDGGRIFQDGQAEELGAKNAQVISRLFDLARKLSGMTDADVKELEKN